MYCTHCGSQNSAEARFCSQCGTPIRREGQDAGAQGHPPAEQPHDSTIIFGGPAKGDKADTDERQALGDADAAAVDALPEGSALLIVTRGPGAGSRYLLDTDLTTVGRHPESDIFLDDITVSRRHVEFRRREGGFVVNDLGSLNGTYVNGDRIDDARLQNGDEVRIGKFRLVFFDSAAKGN